MTPIPIYLSQVSTTQQGLCYGTAWMMKYNTRRERPHYICDLRKKITSCLTENLSEMFTSNQV